MPELRQCIECGKAISSDLNMCPHCKGVAFGVTCHVCMKTLKKSDAVPAFLPGHYFNAGFEINFGYKCWGQSIYLHKACRREIDIPDHISKDKNIHCTLCKNPILIKGFHLASTVTTQRINCPSCGHRIELSIKSEEQIFTSCCYCKEPVEKASALKPLVHESLGSTSIRHAHPACYNSDRQAWELNIAAVEKLRKKRADPNYQKLRREKYKQDKRVTNLFSLDWLMQTKENVGDGQVVDSLEDALKLPKGNEAKVNCHDSDWRSSTNFSPYYYEIDFDNEVLAQILTYNFNSSANTQIKAKTQAELITKWTQAQKIDGGWLYRHILPLLIRKQLYFSPKIIEK